MKRRSYALLIVLVVLSAFACSSKKQEKFTIGVSQPIMDSWRASMNEEIRRELLFHDNIDAVFYEATNSSEIQIRQIREMVDNGVDLLIISPNEVKPVTPVIDDLYERGIPIILLDRKINSDKYTAYIGANNRMIGVEAAKYATRLISDRGRVLEVYGSQSISAFQERSNGFHNILNEKQKIVLDSVEDLERGREQFIEMINRHHYDVIFAHTDVAAKYAYDLVKEQKGSTESIKFIGVDALPGPDEGMEMVEKGILTATLLYPTGGKTAVKVASDILEGKSVQKHYPLKTLIIDQTNISAIRLQTNKLIEQYNDMERLAYKITEMLGVFRNQRILINLFAAMLVLSIVLLVAVIYFLIQGNKANKQLKEKNREIIRISLEAERANQERLTFFTNISHEFRTPLTLILSPLENLLARSDTSFFKTELDMIRKNSLRLLRLVNQVMDFRKIDGGRMQLRAVNADLGEFVQDIVQTFQSAARAKNIDLYFHSDQNQTKVWFDPGLFDKVIFNLLSNAIKFTPKGGRVQVKVEQHQLDEEVLLVVEDTGTGLSERDQQHIFDRFYQGDSNRTLGVGIGLSLTKHIVELHHGDIEVNSKLNMGTRFTIHLKMGRDHLTNAEIVDSVQEFVASEPILEDLVDSIPDDDEKLSKSEHTIMLVEDNQELRAYLKNQLSQQYSVIGTSSVKEGIHIAFEEIPDLIICDLMVGDEDGFELIRALRSDLRTAHIPAVILTSKSGTEDKIKGIRLGADDYITKPFNVSFLMERIKTLIANRDKLREHYLSELPIEQVVSESPSKLNKKFINEFTAIVEQNLSNPGFGVNDICEGLGLSRVQLYRKVKAILGYSVNDYINKVRLKRAKHLLHENHSVSEVSHMVGFSSPAYFSTAFKNHFGKTPTEYRNEL